MLTSLAFPKMFAANRVSVVSDNTATLLNSKLILKSETKEFLGNPEFGTLLVSLLFSNNAPALKEIIIDNIYQTLINYIPLINISRDDIEITLDVTSMYATIKIYNKTTNSNDLFNISLTKDKLQFGENT